jgi:hypothetical protein
VFNFDPVLTPISIKAGGDGFWGVIGDNLYGEHHYRIWVSVKDGTVEAISKTGFSDCIQQIQDQIAARK